MTDPVLKELKSMRWVADAVKTKEGYAVRTKPGAFKMPLTHKIREGRSAYDGFYTAGQLLTTPTQLTLPEYWFYLYDPEANPYRPFKISLTQQYDKAQERIGIIPQYHDLRASKEAGQEYVPCYGMAGGEANSERTYRMVKTWRDRANEVAIYLQSAVPHYNAPWYTTAFAYRLGLVGDEYRDDLNKTEAVAEAETTK